MNRFASVEEYYSTLFHELSHSTGHSSRLDRKCDTEPKPFGSPDYGKEELIAEMSAAFLCSRAGIQPVVIGNQAAYVAGWLKQIKADKKLVISAASQAQRSSDWICGERNSRIDWRLIPKLLAVFGLKRISDGALVSVLRFRQQYHRRTTV